MVFGDVVHLLNHVDRAGFLVSWVWGSNFDAGATMKEMIVGGVCIIDLTAFLGSAKIAGSVGLCVNEGHPVSDQCVCVHNADIFSDDWAGGCAPECVVV